MAILDIVTYPNEILTRKAEPYTEFGPELAKLAADMIETMDAYDGVGLAGPQIGLSKRIFVMRHPDSGHELCLINPVLLAPEGCVVAEEGCLSFPFVYANVPRAERIRVQAMDISGRPIEFVAEGWCARIVQHETDHLDGVVFPDRLDVLSKDAVLREYAAAIADAHGVNDPKHEAL